MFLTFLDEDNKPYNIHVVPKQKIVQIHRERGIDFELNRQAIKQLSSDAYTLYMYILTRCTTKAWYLSSTDVYENTSLRRRTYTKAIAELQEKKYLIPGPIKTPDGDFNNNTFHLVQSPDCTF